MDGLAAGRAAATRGTLAAAGFAVTALAAGFAGVAAAQFVHPAVGPAAAVAAVVFAVTLSRPEVGLAAWFVMIPLGELGLLGRPHWLLPSGWAALLFTLALVRASSDAHRVQPPFFVPILGFTALTILGGLGLTESLSDALPLIRMMVVGTMLFYAIAVLVRNRRQVLWVLAALAVAAAIPGLAALREFRSGGTDYGFLTASGELVARATSGFGQPNQLGGFLVLIVLMALAGAAVARRGRLLFVAAALLGVVGIYLSFSRSALLALVAGALVLLGLRRALLAAPAALAAVLAMAPGLLKERFATLTSSGSELATRNDIWSAAQSIWSSHPVLGVGPGGFPAAYATERLPGKDYLPTTLFAPPPHAHNLPLHVLAEQGVVGFVTLAGVAVLVVSGLLRVRRASKPWVRWTARGLLAALTGFGVHNLFDVTLLEGTGSYLFALLGLAAALVVVAREDQRPISARGAAGPDPPV